MYRPRRVHALAFEGLERREVPSSTALLASSALLPRQVSSPPAQGSFPLLYRPFVARFQGAYIVGPPRTSSQVSQTYGYGGGISSAFLHADLQMAFFTPTDPGQPIFGQAVMMLKDVGNTGNELALDLTAVPGAVDRRGRPTQFTWTVNGASGGSFTAGEGSGTARVLYSPGQYPGQGHLRNVLGSGHFGIIFQGSLGTTNLFNILRNQ
jgi:hypothetical protein